MNTVPGRTVMQTDLCSYIVRPQPKVTLLNATPEWVVAQATKGYTGVYTATPISLEEQNKFWQELGDTKLKGPLEMATTFWLIEDVTRAFTHQFARYRIGVSMVQESQRFSKQVGKLARIMIPDRVVNNSSAMEEYVESCETAMRAYYAMLDAEGVETQDARGLLPTNICTRLYTTIAMTGLAHMYEQRHCCQAQDSGAGENGEWKQVVQMFKRELQHQGYYHYANTLKAPWEDPRCTNCGFGASFDRPCSYQGKFDSNLVKLYDAFQSTTAPE